MEKQKKTGFEEVSRRVESVRRIYSRIGEPLPVDVMIDLYRHLGAALEAARQGSGGKKAKRSPRH